MAAVSVSVRAGDYVVEVSDEWAARARWLRDGGEVAVQFRRQAPVVFSAYVLSGRWRSHGLGRSDVPREGKQVARRALRKLDVPTVGTSTDERGT